MTKLSPSGVFHFLWHGLLTLAVVALGSWSVAAQEAPVEDAPPPVDEASLPPVDPAYLAPLSALAGNETAFVDQLWTMGNTEFENLSTKQAELGQLQNEAEVDAKRAEIALCVAHLKALAEFGVKSYEQNARVRNFNGTVAYDAFNRQMDGVKEWLAAVSLDSEYSDPYNNLGMHYFHAGEYALGFQNMDRALELEPKNPDYCFNMAQNYLIYRPQTETQRGWDAKRIYKEAMKLSKKATKLAPDDFEILQDYAVNFLAAENFGEKPDWKAAAKAWENARKHAKRDVDLYFTWLNEGRSWRALGNTEEARRCFQEAVAATERNPGLTLHKDLPQRLLAEVSGDQ